MSISSNAEACTALFEARLKSAFEEVEPEAQARRDLLITQRARFNLWADNNGVFAESSASLDSRIQEHQDIIDVINGQLSLLQRHLARLDKFVCHKSTSAEVQAAIDRLDQSSTSSVSFSDSLSTITSDNDNSEADEPSEATSCANDEPASLVAIINANRRLHRISMAIRQASSASSHLKATRGHFIDENGVNLIDVFRKWCLELLQHRFKTADRRVLERLAQANGERRRIFLYRKQHEAKLRGRRTSAQTIGTNYHSIGQPFGAPEMPSANNEADVRKSPGTHSVAKASIAQQTSTTASFFNRKEYRYEPSTQTTMFTASPSTQRLVDNSIWPPAPKVPAGAAEFFCPYCSKIQPASERSGRRWKAHFLRDLSPFVCLIENCHDPYHLYPDQQSWLRHMESHNVEYACRQHPKPLKFQSASEFDSHVLQEHRKLPPAQLVRLRSINDTRSRIDICNCPICGAVPTKAPTPGMSVANHDAAYKELLDHIAHDLHYIAMSSLEEVEDLNESIPSDPSEFKVANESTIARSITASDVEDTASIDESGEWIEEPYSTPVEEQDLPEYIPDRAELADQWVFARPSSSNSLDTGLDPKLETFVRRYQLEKLLEEGKAADPQLPFHFIPADPVNDFYGREKALLQLENHLHPARASKELRTMTLTGPSGIGKTKLAERFCHRYRTQYDVILWVHADQDAKLADDYAQIAIGLGFVGKDSIESRDHDHCRQLVKAWLTNPLKHREQRGEMEKATWLLVLDHIIDSNAADDYWPSGCKSGSILITSRKPMPWRSTYYPVLEVEPFNAEESAAFLFSQINGQELNGRTIKLGPNAVYTPTQLYFLAKTISTRRYSLEKFLQASQDDNGKQTILLLHTEDATKNQADFAEWALESLNPKAGALLDMMSMLDPDDIQESLLTDPPDIVSIVNYPRTLEEYHHARSELLAFTFISRQRQKRSLSTLRVVQDAARRNMSPRHYRSVFNSCVALINDEWPYQDFTWRHGTDRWSLCEDLYPHIARLLGFSKNIDLTEDQIDAAYGFARLATDVAWYCHERGQSSTGVEFCDAALSICLKLKSFLKADPKLSKVINIGRLNTTIAEIHHNHGVTVAEMNRPEEALKHQLIFNRMMTTALEANPGTDMRLAMSFNQLGVAYMLHNDFFTGQECFRRAVAEMRRLEDFEEWKISLPLVNLGYCYYFDQRYTEAEEILQKGLADRVAKFGENDRESFITGRFYNALALVKQGQGKEDDCYRYLKLAQEHYRSTVGRGHHRSADVAVAIGQYHYRAGEYKAASDSLKIAIQTYGDRTIYTPEKARAHFRRAKARRKLGKAHKAQRDEEECLKLYREAVPGDFRSLDELSDADFDQKIVFWSR